MTARERACRFIDDYRNGVILNADSLQTMLDAHAAEAVAARDAVWREAVEAVRKSYWPAAYLLCCDHILAEVERRTKGGA